MIEFMTMDSVNRSKHSQCVGQVRVQPAGRVVSHENVETVAPAVHDDHVEAILEYFDKMEKRNGKWRLTEEMLNDADDYAKAKIEASKLTDDIAHLAKTRSSRHRI